MEIFVALLVVLASCLAVVITRFVLNRRKSHKLLKNLGIPGPETNFLTGNMEEFLSAPTPNDAITKWLKAYGNIFGFYIGDRPHIIIKDLDLIKQIFIRDFEYFCNRPHGLDVYPINKTLIGLRDKRWKEVRTFLTLTFSSSKIKFMTRIVDKKVDVAVSVVAKKAENNEMFDMYELVQGLTIDVIADCAFAMKTNCQENPKDVLLTTVRDAFRVSRNKFLLYAVMFPFVRDLMGKLYKYSTAGRLNTLIMDSVSKAITERRKNREAKCVDLLQLMLEHSEGEDKTVAGMTDEEILANAYLFLLAGYETTATALAFTFYLLIKHPDVQEKLYKEISEVEDVDYNTVQRMEGITILLAIITACIAVLFACWTKSRQKHHNLFKRCGIPGPEPDFWTGNLKEIKRSPTPNEAISAWLKKYGDVFGYFNGELPFIVIKDLEMLKQIFIKDFHVFCDRPFVINISPLNKTLIGLKGKRWKEVRSILTPNFSTGKIKLMSQIVSRKVDITVEVVTKKAENGEIFDMYQVVQGLTLDVIADCALAMKARCQENQQDVFLTSARKFFHHVHNSALEYAIMFPSVKYIMRFLSKFMTAGQMTRLIVDNVNKSIGERRKNLEIKSMDFVQLMLDNREKDGIAVGLSDEEIVANAYLFILGGYESTATSLAYAFYLLVTHPEIQEKLYEEIKSAEDDSYITIQSLPYLNQILTESLRLYPPVTGFINRECNKDYQIGSITIPKGSIVQAPVWDIHHDPELWPDPWTFDPDRFSPENKASVNSMAYMPFGIGRRNCIASHFALAEAKLAIFKLVKKFRFEACEKTDNPLTLICPSVITAPANGVYLRAVPRIVTV